MISSHPVIQSSSHVSISVLREKIKEVSNTSNQCIINTAKNNETNSISNIKMKH